MKITSVRYDPKSDQDVPKVGSLDPANCGRGLAALHRASQRSHGQSRKPDLITSPLDGISDVLGHPRSPNCRFEGAASHPGLDANRRIASVPRPHSQAYCDPLVYVPHFSCRPWTRPNSQSSRPATSDVPSNPASPLLAPSGTGGPCTSRVQFASYRLRPTP